VWSGDHTLLSSGPGRPRKSDGGEGWNLGGLKALLPRASGERWAFTYMYGGLGLSGLVGSRGLLARWGFRNVKGSTRR